MPGKVLEARSADADVLVWAGESSAWYREHSGVQLVCRIFKCDE